MPEPTLYLDKEKKPEHDIILNDPQDNLLDTSSIRIFDDDVMNTDDHIRGWLKWRYDQMFNARPDQDWDLRYKQYLAVISWNTDGSANVNLPIEAATIRNKMADALSQRPLIKFRPQTKDDVNKLQLTKVLWDFVWHEADTDKELFDLFMGAYIFGTYPWMEYLHKETFTRYIPETDKDGKITAKPVTETKSWLKGKAWDIRDVWVDLTHSLDTSVDCIVRERDVSYDQLNNKRNEDGFYNIDEALQAEGFDQANIAFQTIEEMKNYPQLTRKYVLYHYYNREKGIYIVNVNWKVIIYKGANPYAHGELPISLLVDHKNLQQIYGRGECELLENTKYERNVVRNQYIDYVRASNTMALAVGEGAGFEGSDMINGIMQIWNFSGNIRDSQLIKPPPMDNGLLELDKMLMEDSTWITGIDNNSLVGEPANTAFEARLQEVTKLKGINISLKQADYFFERIGRQRLANIQQFLPTTTGKLLVSENTDGYREIAVSDKRLKTIKGIDKKGQLQEAGIGFEEAKGEYAFLELKPEMIKSNLCVVIETPSTSPILREINRAEMTELFNNVIKASQIAPEVLKEFDVTQWLQDNIEELGYDAQRYFKGSQTGTDIEQVKQSLVGDIPMPPKAKNQPQRTDLASLGALLGGGGQPQPTGAAAGGKTAPAPVA